MQIANKSCRFDAHGACPVPVVRFPSLVEHCVVRVIPSNQVEHFASHIELQFATVFDKAAKESINVGYREFELADVNGQQI